METVDGLLQEHDDTQNEKIIVAIYTEKRLNIKRKLTMSTRTKKVIGSRILEYPRRLRHSLIFVILRTSITVD